MKTEANKHTLESRVEKAKDWLASCGLFTQDKCPKNIRNVSGENHTEMVANVYRKDQFPNFSGTNIDQPFIEVLHVARFSQCEGGKEWFFEHDRRTIFVTSFTSYFLELATYQNKQSIRVLLNHFSRLSASNEWHNVHREAEKKLESIKPNHVGIGNWTRKKLEAWINYAREFGRLVDSFTEDVLRRQQQAREHFNYLYHLAIEKGFKESGRQNNTIYLKRDDLGEYVLRIEGEKHVSWNLYTNPSNPVQFFNAIK